MRKGIGTATSKVCCSYVEEDAMLWNHHPLSLYLHKIKGTAKTGKKNKEHCNMSLLNISQNDLTHPRNLTELMSK